MSKQEDCLQRGWPPAAVSGWRFGAKRRSDGKKRGTSLEAILLPLTENQKYRL